MCFTITLKGEVKIEFNSSFDDFEETHHKFEISESAHWRMPDPLLTKLEVDLTARCMGQLRVRVSRSEKRMDPSFSILIKTFGLSISCRWARFSFWKAKENDLLLGCSILLPKNRSLFPFFINKFHNSVIGPKHFKNLIFFVQDIFKNYFKAIFGMQVIYNLRLQ